MSIQRKKTKEAKRVLVGMSGGVDSSLAAALLVEQGYDVTAAFMKNYSDSKDLWTGECDWKRERRDAMRVAAKLGIPLFTLDFEEAYGNKVLDRMFREYEKGITPNPDVLCNEEIKFGLFFEKAMELGFDYIATGHYARVEKNEDGEWKLLKGKDANKDQSYFLHRIAKETLPHILFPIGSYRKEDVRRMASERNLITAEKPDSQGICFVGDLDMKEFLRKKIKAKPGEVVTPEGKIIGTHDGLDGVTIGQRHGFHIEGGEHAWYAAGKERVQNRLIVVPTRDHELLYSKKAFVEDVHWLAQPVKGHDMVSVAVRYRAKEAPAKIEKMSKNKLILGFLEPVWGLAPGQSAVLYDGDICLGGGFISDPSL